MTQGIIFHVSHPTRARPSNQWSSSSDGFVNRLGTNFDISENVSQQQQHLVYPFGPSLLYSQQQHESTNPDDDTMQPSNSFSLFANNSLTRRVPLPSTSPSMIIAPPPQPLAGGDMRLENRSLLGQVAEDNAMEEEVAIISSSERRPSTATRSSSMSSLRPTTASPDHSKGNLFDIQRVMDGM